jgi:hypothetical protein
LSDKPNPFGVSASYPKPATPPPLVLPVGASQPPPLVVTITHEMFMPWVTLAYGDRTEELEHLEALEWFKERGVRGKEAMAKVNEMINEALNFGRAEVTIKRPLPQKVGGPHPVDPLV